jgi:hypothetical protein
MWKAVRNKRRKADIILKKPNKRTFTFAIKLRCKKNILMREWEEMGG